MSNRTDKIRACIVAGGGGGGTQGPQGPEGPPGFADLTENDNGKVVVIGADGNPYIIPTFSISRAPPYTMLVMPEPV